MPTAYFITHPDVLIDPAVPVPEWPLSPRGQQRMWLALGLPWIGGIAAIWCSTERKACDGADVLAGHLGLPVQQSAALGENDRSATGYLPKAEFEVVADAFFAHPSSSVHGWETAEAAQRRIVGAFERILSAPIDGDIAIVSHGAVGTLLMCHLAKESISREHDQPPGNGGNYFAVDIWTRKLLHRWRSIDAG